MSHKTNEQDHEQELSKAFKVVDRDDDGFISVEELRQTLTPIGENITAHELKEMIREADNDLDGRIRCK